MGAGTTMQLGDVVKAEREKRGWSQKELAQRSKLGQGYLSLFERNQRPNVSADVLRRLADAFEISVDALLQLAGKMPPPAEGLPLPVPEDVAATLRKVGPQLSDQAWQRVVGYLDRLAEEAAPYTPAPPDDETKDP